jgi:hypothetical protein
MMIMATEFLSMLVIQASLTPLDVVFNFVALTILADFDSMTYEALPPSNLKKLLNEDIQEKLLII